MKKLFIIGNGFDLSHGLNTSYEDFKAYLVKKYGYINNEDGTFLLKCPSDESNDISFIVDIIDRRNSGDLWRNVEDDIGYFDRYIDFYINEKEWSYDLQKLAGAWIATILNKIPRYFSEWINSIDINDIKIKDTFVNLIDPNNDVFLTFNYTLVLEKIYHATNVCHIHGKQGENLIFGHGYDLSYASEFNLREDLECGLVESYEQLKKNTIEQIQSNIEFFNGLEDIQEIYSYGFSFSTPDVAYIKKICEVTNIDTIWYLSDFDTKIKQDEYRELLFNNGFKGQVKSFRI